MKFLANENIPISSINYLKSIDVDIKSIGLDNPSVSDEQVMDIAINEDRTIIAYDSDYGELIFKYNNRPQAGVIFIRNQPENPLDTARVLQNLIDKDISFENALTVVSSNNVRQKKY